MATTETPAGTRSPAHSFSYELTALLLLGLAYGFAYFDRMSMTFLGPFVAEGLSLNKTEIGWLGSGLSLTWALGAYFVGRWSDSIGKRKPFLLGALVVFSLCSVLSGLAWNFSTLFATRVVMGMAEGPFLPICLAIIASASAASRKGLNSGIVQNAFGSIIGTVLAPWLLVSLATAYSWRAAFYLAGVPGLILALLIWLFIADPELPSASYSRHGHGETPLSQRIVRMVVDELKMLIALLRNPNIRICSAVSIFAIGSVVIGSIFMPFYLDGPRHIAPETWKWMMAVVGFSPALGAVLLGLLSDRIGRKPPMILGGLLMALPPSALLFVQASPAALTALMFLGWMGMGIFPLFMGVVPGETLGRARAATAMGMVVMIGELTGGVFGPPIAGKLADNYSLDVPMWIQAGLALGAALAALGLAETNQRVLARRVD